MGFERYIAITLLLGVVVTSHFGMFDLAERNGTFTFTSIFAFKDRILPNSKVPVHIPQTGIDLLDNYVAFMLSVFWVDLDPKNVRAHIQGHHFLGTLSGTWLLMLVECHRGQKSAAFFFATYFIEFVGELAGLGLFTPLWCIIHLATTATPSTKTKAVAEKTFLPSSGNLRPLGYAIFVGHVIPTLLMSFGELDQPGILSQQVWILARLFHPIFIFGLWKLFSSFTKSPAPLEASIDRAASSRKFYTFSILFSMMHHITALAVVFAEYWIPNWLRSEVLTALDPKATFLPFPFWQTERIQNVSFTNGISTFLQWDETLTAAAALIWTSALYFESAKQKRSIIDTLSTLLQGLAVGVLAGPVATAAFLLQERDNAVANSNTDAIKKNN